MGRDVECGGHDGFCALLNAIYLFRRRVRSDMVRCDVTH